MDRYTYEVTGEYGDWCEIKRGEDVLHDGSLMGLMTPGTCESNLELNLNYGTETISVLEIKKVDGLYIAIPKEPDFLSENYTYKSIIFTQKEFEELLSISYIDEKYQKNIPAVADGDIMRLWLCTFENRESYIDFPEMKSSIIDNIIAFSIDNVENVKGVILKIFEKGRFLEISDIKDIEMLTVYVDKQNEISEWNALVKVGNKFFLRVDDWYIYGH
jgi:hypothetical protein